MSAPGVVSAPGGLSAPSRGVSQHALKQTPFAPPWTEFLTHACENITLAQLRNYVICVKFHSNMLDYVLSRDNHVWKILYFNL